MVNIMSMDLLVNVRAKDSVRLLAWNGLNNLLVLLINYMTRGGGGVLESVHGT